MLKLISIALSSLILLQSLGLSVRDVAQIDDFIEHANFHSEAYGDNVFVFISKHYGELKASHESEHREEHGEHEQLPFHQSQISAISAFVLTSQNEEFKIIELLEFESHNFFYQEPSSSLYTEITFQPPRLS